MTRNPSPLFRKGNSGRSGSKAARSIPIQFAPDAPAATVPIFAGARLILRGSKPRLAQLIASFDL